MGVKRGRNLDAAKAASLKWEALQHLLCLIASIEGQNVLQPMYALIVGQVLTLSDQGQKDR